jgi:hypothetical protein
VDRAQPRHLDRPTHQLARRPRHPIGRSCWEQPRWRDAPRTAARHPDRLKRLVHCCGLAQGVGLRAVCGEPARNHGLLRRRRHSTS